MLFLQQIARVNICNIYSLVNLKNYFWVLFFSTLNCSYWLNTSFIVAPRKQNSMCKSGCIRQELQSFHHVTSPTKWEIGRDHTVRVMSVATMAPHTEQLSPFPFSKLSITSALQDCLYDSMTPPPPPPFSATFKNAYLHRGMLRGWLSTKQHEVFKSCYCLILRVGSGWAEGPARWSNSVSDFLIIWEL